MSRGSAVPQWTVGVNPMRELEIGSTNTLVFQQSLQLVVLALQIDGAVYGFPVFYGDEARVIDDSCGCCGCCGCCCSHVANVEDDTVFPQFLFVFVFDAGTFYDPRRAFHFCGSHTVTQSTNQL